MKILAAVLLVCASGAAQMWPNPGPGMVPAIPGGGGPSVKTITIDHTKVGSSDATAFPMLISGTYSYLKTSANGGAIMNTVAQPLYSLTVPADLKFASVSGCATGLLKWEFETYVATTGAVNIWVQIPTLSHSADTLIYMCYGDASVTTWQGGAKGSVWDASYAAVWHMAQASNANAEDATANSNTGVRAGTTTAIAGKVGGAISFNGSNSDFNVGSAASLDDIQLQGGGGLTAEAWLSADSNATSIIYAKGDHSNGTGFLEFQKFNSTNPARLQLGKDGSADLALSWNSFLDTGAWVHFVITWTGGTAISSGVAYRNGSLATQGFSTAGAAFFSDTAQNAHIGSRSASSAFLDGDLDELRLSNVVRSADWILAEYNNQSSPSTFYSITP